MTSQPQKSTRTILLFDVMETLVREPFFDVIPPLFEMDRDELLRHKHPSSWIEFEQGRISEEEYFARFFRDGRTIDGVAVRRALYQAYGWIDGMESLLQELHAAGYEMHALSNYPEWYQWIDRKLALSRFLDWSFVSCLTGVRKPDPAAYLVAIDRLQRAANECLFIDDRPINVNAAMAVGMDAIVMTTVEELRLEFKQRGILAQG